MTMMIVVVIVIIIIIIIIIPRLFLTFPRSGQDLDCSQGPASPSSPTPRAPFTLTSRNKSTFLESAASTRTKPAALKAWQMRSTTPPTPACTFSTKHTAGLCPRRARRFFRSKVLVVWAPVSMSIGYSIADCRLDALRPFSFLSGSRVPVRVLPQPRAICHQWRVWAGAEWGPDMPGLLRCVV